MVKFNCFNDRNVGASNGIPDAVRVRSESYYLGSASDGHCRVSGYKCSSNAARILSLPVDVQGVHAQQRMTDPLDATSIRSASLPAATYVIRRGQ